MTAHSDITRLSERVWRLRAPNPGPMTLTGTNSYLIGLENGASSIALDPGPIIEEHLQNLIAAAPAPIGLILVTHGHPDHYPGAARLRELTGAPVAAHSLATFERQRDLQDGEKIQLENTTLLAIHTPGHAPDHLCFYLQEEGALFTGDTILGQGTTVVAPPKGDMAHYMASLRLLEEQWGQATVLYGGHGPEITAPLQKFREYITHRQARQQQLMEALQRGPATIGQLVAQIYTDVDKRLWLAAGRQVLAYLIMLEREGAVNAVEVAATETDNLLTLTGIPLDPVAAAELGISGQPSTEKAKLYSLVGN